MRFLSPFALATLALTSPHPQEIRRTNSPLELRIEMDGNSKVRAVLTNRGSKDLHLLKTGTLLGSAPVEKARVYNGTVHPDNAVEFNGVRLQVATSELGLADFHTLGAGDSVTTDFDLAHMHDLSAGGEYHVELSGELPTVAVSSGEVDGSVAYHSNRLSIRVDGVAAGHTASSYRRGLERRTRVQGGCRGRRLQTTQAALASCVKIATAASKAASGGPASKMHEYFKAADNGTRRVVADVFARIARECGTVNGGRSDYYCRDKYGHCKPTVLAYTMMEKDAMCYCERYFRTLPAHTKKCHGRDQPTTNIHEMTHLRRIKGTSDFNGYGYGTVQNLTREQNLNHADTYTLFALAIELKC
ncbi:hypothetical protein V2A60_003462 [Cordyceps javanica]